MKIFLGALFVLLTTSFSLTSAAAQSIQFVVDTPEGEPKIDFQLMIKTGGELTVFEPFTGGYSLVLSASKIKPNTIFICANITSATHYVFEKSDGSRGKNFCQSVGPNAEGRRTGIFRFPAPLLPSQ